MKRGAPVFAALSAILSLACCELLVRAVRGGFPYLNIFVPHAKLGVTLEPSAHTKLRSLTGRVTPIRTNSAGFRGPEFARAPDSVLLLGDSQMFGYGVHLDESTSALLQAQRSAPVLNAAVPTWGPHEYVAISRALIPKFKPRTVVFVANLRNDWWETMAKNTRRTTAQDGWALHAKAPSVAQFPGRRWLMGRSQLVFLAKSLLAHTSAGIAPRGGAIHRLLDQQPMLSRKVGAHHSRLSPFLEAIVALCAEHDCQVIAATLPLDVQVDETQWSKYRVEPRDTASLRELSDTFLLEAKALGAHPLDLHEPLASTTSAFLDDDYHLSPAGHRAIASALSARISKVQE